MSVRSMGRVLAVGAVIAVLPLEARAQGEVLGPELEGPVEHAEAPELDSDPATDEDRAARQAPAERVTDPGEVGGSRPEQEDALPHAASLQLERPGQARSYIPPVSVRREGMGSLVLRADDLEVRLGGYAEAFYAWSFGEPSNGVIAERGFDNRHHTFTIGNVALGADFAYDRVSARIWLQVGHTPASYYAAEPVVPAAGGAAASDPELWRIIQEAYVAWNAPLGDRGVSIEGGLFLSPIGVESLAIHENWTWSNSNLFFGLPFYHTGVRATVPIEGGFSFTVAGYNGWNTVLDNNDEKSLSASVVFESDDVQAAFVYFGGVERDREEVERPWRHVFDLGARVVVTPWLSLLGHFDVGFEDRAIGFHPWVAGALYAHVQPLEWLSFGLRGDFFWEGAPEDSDGSRLGPIFWGVEWVSSATVSIGLRPVDRILFRLEYRRDEAAGPAYFAGQVPVDLETGLDRPNATRQDTITLGATAWF